MSEGQQPQNVLIQEKKENISPENKLTPLNHQNNDIQKNNQSNSQETKEDLKLGHYMLTPLQSILINKKMPFGFKLETEENFIKSFETSKNQTKKIKNNARNKENTGKSNNRNNGMLSQKKRNQYLGNIDNIPNNLSPEIIGVLKKCKKGLEKIKESKYCNNYYQSNNPEIPCLANIEKKVNNYEYKNLYDFEMDVRKIWYHYFEINKYDEITKKMSEDWEKICTDLDTQNNEMTMNNIKKRTDKLQKELDDFKDLSKDSLPAPVKKVNQQNNDHNKPMTVEEKNQLGNNIRTLNKEQLKGIIKILNENNSVPKSKYFEFDIDKLPTKKLRELEKYVKECLIVNNKNLLNNTNNKNVNMNQNQVNKNSGNNKTNNNQNQNQNSATKNSVKEGNKTQEIKQEPSSLKKNKSGKKSNNNRNESFSESESISSDSSLSN